MKLTESEKQKIVELIQAGKTIPAVYKSKLFDSGDSEFIEATKDYRLVYKGKARKENIIAGTSVAPFQKVRSFNSDNPFDQDWRNMLIFGDNLLALKTLYDDQRNENRYKTKNRIKLIYIDPPFATKQDFMKDREKAYRDKIIGAQFIEFLRKRLILMREILADDGSIYVHLDWKKGHYIKAIMDEVFGEHNFVNEIIWGYRRWSAASEGYQKSFDSLFFVYEKARKGDLAITDTFLKNFAGFISENLSGNKEQSFSLACPKDKFKVHKLKVTENEDGKAGKKTVTVGKVKFLISFIQPKEKTEKEKPLKAKEFTLYNAGIYDNKQILNMDWESYKPFVTQLFGLRPEPHKIHGFTADGYIGIHSAYIWDYPNQKNLVLDTGYVKTLHTVLGGRAGNKFYVIAPVLSMGFMEDEIPIDGTTYVFLKVPLSILMALIEKGEPGSLKQPVSENDVNEVIDAVGFDFISQPEVAARYCRKVPENRNLFNQKHKDFVIEITQFKSNTLVYDPEDFENFETLSMVLIDTNYNGEHLNLDKVFWADKILDEAKTKAVIRIPQNEFAGKKMLVIFMDKYGNELKVLKSKGDFK